MLRARLIWCVLGLLVVALVVPAFAHAMQVWSTDEEFGYGWLITPISVGLLALRRRQVAEAIGSGHGTAGGLVLAAAAVALFAFERRSGIHVVAGLAVPPLLLGVVAFVWGWRAARVVAFPVVFLLFGLALFRGLLSSVGFWLQGVSAVGSEIGAQMAGLAVSRNDLLLQGQNFTFVVAEACSGMSSLLSLLALVTLGLSILDAGWVTRAVVGVSVLPVVVLANVTRITLVLWVADRFGSDAALGFFHGASSLVLFSLALGLLVLETRVLSPRAARLLAWP